MWRISYLDLKDDELKQKGGFDSDKAAIEWADSHKEDIVPLKLLVWSEYLGSYRTVLEF